MTETPDHIIVVDDDPDIRELLGDYLGKSGFHVSTVPDGTSLQHILDKEPVSLVVLDLTLPGEDGLVICRNLRANSNLPVIILSARSEEMDRIIGLEMGADDYLAKPFHPRELLARVKSVLRRVNNGGSDSQSPENDIVYQFAGWSLDGPARRLISPGGSTIPLSGSEFALLRIFLDHPNRVLSRDQLLDLSHGRETAPFDRTIDMQVSRLRRRLNDDSRNPTFIKTVRSAGYVFCVRVERKAPTLHY